MAKVNGTVSGTGEDVLGSNSQFPVGWLLLSWYEYPSELV